ncbi:glycosyltransferase family 39 protein [Hoeflea sp. WL0058]|uniref:Glycosyltransferase family 39 protein n=1 Tax=Flavimaribacter sediminis TaxID=2865987 RepID=A0AAE2ZMF3_9HYPH|nr:glycosyltransferase family 39 protein [Flavimaribacter sediminis]MBW8637365.1 glycosyltransferase family 39 protein [Flavimaribacter sediminis]
MSNGSRLRPLQAILVFLFGLLVIAPGIGQAPPTDRDEARFIQATKQMVETGDYVDIRFQDESRYKKPVGIYWLQAASVQLLGGGVDASLWTYRIVSTLAMALAGVAVLWIGGFMFGPAAGLIAAVMFIGTFGVAFEGRLAKTDSVLLLLSILAQGFLARIYLARRYDVIPAAHWSWMFWVAQGLAILVKGPITPLLSGLTVATIVVFDRGRARRWLADLRPLRGALLALLIATPWLVLITWKSEGAFWQEALGRDLIGKVAGGQESHGAPPGYYLLTYSLFVWPFGFLALVGGANALRRMRADARLLFCVAWYLPFFVVFEIIPTKLPHYMLPAYPAILLMGAWCLTLSEQDRNTPLLWQRVLHGLGAFGTGVVAVGLAVVSVGLPIYLKAGFQWQGLAAAILILLAGWFALVNTFDLTPMRRVLFAALAASIAYCTLFASVLPGLDRLWLNRQIAERFAEEKPCETSVLGSLSFREPSLVFLVGTDRVQNLRPHNVAEFLAENGACGVVAMSDKDATSVFASLPGGREGMIAGEPIVGVNYSKGRELQIRLYRTKP